ncbi:MAG: hypothetical protein LAT66_08700, partial [Alkalimonas sp.]|nr:hypothetical protein [Alkalimonas sp.]
IAMGVLVSLSTKAQSVSTLSALRRIKAERQQLMHSSVCLDAAASDSTGEAQNISITVQSSRETEGRGDLNS